MRGAVSCLLFSMLPVFAGDLASSSVTVVLDFEGQHSTRALQTMERETEGILKGSGLRFDWKMRDEAAAKTFANLVIVRFKGNCGPQAPTQNSGGLGTLAFTYASDGVVQPFSEVSCDKIGAFLLSGLKSRENTDPEKTMGIALGRVLAHELVHMLLGSETHGDSGVFKSGLTVQQLVSGELQLDDEDADRLRAAPWKSAR
jgi:hypothetical protein